MPQLVEFVLSVVAGVIANSISKWLDEGKKTDSTMKTRGYNPRVFT